MDTSFAKKKAAATPNISTDGIGIYFIQFNSIQFYKYGCLNKIDILSWEHEEEGYPPITFGIWDFAGQEVYYSTHQFFLTTRSIYMIVFSIFTIIVDKEGILDGMRYDGIRRNI